MMAWRRSLQTMNSQQQDVKKYIRTSVKNLSCSRTNKIEFIKEATHNLDKYIEENPECTNIDIEVAFGTPEIMAANFMETISHEEVQKAKNCRRLKIRAICVMCFVLLALVAYLVYTLYSLPEYELETTTIVYSKEPMPDFYREISLSGSTVSGEMPEEKELTSS